jgi:hypothetical protein
MLTFATIKKLIRQGEQDAEMQSEKIEDQSEQSHPI